MAASKNKSLEGGESVFLPSNAPHLFSSPMSAVVQVKTRPQAIPDGAVRKDEYKHTHAS